MCLFFGAAKVQKISYLPITSEDLFFNRLFYAKKRIPSAVDKAAESGAKTRRVCLIREVKAKLHAPEHARDVKFQGGHTA